MNGPTEWIKARKSTSGNNCVELRRNGTTVEVRDSKDPDGPTLKFNGAELDAFLDGAKNGEFDHLT